MLRYWLELVLSHITGLTLHSVRLGKRLACKAIANQTLVSRKEDIFKSAEDCYFYPFTSSVRGVEGVIGTSAVLMQCIHNNLSRKRDHLEAGTPIS